jgi:hypothetical protein
VTRRRVPKQTQMEPKIRAKALFELRRWGSPASALWATVLSACASGCSLLSLDILQSGEGSGGATSSATTSGGGNQGGAGGEVGGGGTGGGVLGSCGRVDLIDEDFSSTAKFNAWFVSENASLQGRGTLTLNLDGIPGPERFAYAETRYLLDPRESAISVRVDEVLNAPVSGFSETFFRITDGPRYLGVNLVGAQLRLYAWDGSSGVSVLEIPYDSVAHRYWRLREGSGVTHFDTSQNGGTWNTQVSVATENLPSLSLVRVQLGAYSNESLQPPGTASFALLRGSPSPGPACPSASLIDAFDSSSEDSLWRRSSFSGDCVRSYEQSSIVFSFPDTATGACTLRSSSLFDLRGSAASVRVLELPTPGIDTTEGHMGVQTPEGAGISVAADGSWLGVYRTEVGGVRTLEHSEPYDPINHRYWRIRESGGQVRAEVSADGSDFTTIDSRALWFDASRVEVSVGGETSANPGGLGRYRFDDLNILP